MAGRLASSTGKNNENKNRPDLAIHHGAAAVSEYNNPDLMPGMFPTLFPFGIGGFEDKSRPTALSFKEQAQYYFNISDRAFRYHFSYIFVALNMLQRRMAHLHTSFTVKKSNFDLIARKLVAVSPDILNDLAKHLEQEKHISSLSQEHKNAFELLKKVNTISARIPGSQASKIFARNEIRNFFGFFGLPHLFFTFNTSAAHSPIFQVMFGDKTVDLSSRFPKTVSGRERALRLAKDPVAATDFFEFSVNCLFKYLLGWDYSTSSSSEQGGILGKIHAFYGTCEFTERGSLHGHFLIWLLGGINPSDLHDRLSDNTQYQKQFFNYFESIIHHHLPDIEVEVTPNYEPRIERPPIPPACAHDSAIDILNEWDSVFRTELKKCGEVLQRHVCRPVCHKYGNEGKCRFLFPHEIIEASYFDSETNSVFLLCRDGSVNYFNPYILIFCRHNHDLKCILSGKSAKAAMFYITDYITKMDCKTYEVLSLLSRVVSRMPDIVNSSPTDSAKNLLHRCISQFTRQQQIHAQQAVRYLRGFDDTISSHKTVPMMSSLLLSFINANLQNPQSVTVESQEDEEDVEQLPLKIVTNESGELVDTHQVHHYWYRSESLEHMSFYDFCRCIRIEKKSRTCHVKNTHETRLGVLQRHSLKSSHPLHETHHLIEHTNEDRGEGHHELVPRIVGMSIPRETSAIWPFFVLAHFKPFSMTQPLIPANESYENVFQTYSFSDRTLKIIRNWNAIYECEDERDAERLRKRTIATRESAAMTASVGFPELDVENIENALSEKTNSETNFRIQQAVLAMQQSNWLTVLPKNDKFDDNVHNFAVSVVASDHLSNNLPDITNNSLKHWKAETKAQEQTITNNRRNALSPEQQVMIPAVVDTEMFSTFPITDNKVFLECSPTKAPQALNINDQIAPHDVLSTIEQDFNLNVKQVQAFRIISQHFIKKFVLKIATEKPLQMLMTGPGGTGKTHVVKALKEVMKKYGCEHNIRFLVPTGSAASLIDGSTIHKGLGIKILKADGRGKGNRSPGESQEDYTVLVSIKNKSQLRDEWRNVNIVLLDEASLLSAQLLCEIDHALRYAKECPKEWFGGVTIIFAGDFYQYPPVVGTALYTPISMYTGQSNDEIQRRLGRMAWKTIDTVVELTEQQRMKDDQEYANAVQRLRTRQCHFEDVELFNSRMMKSVNCPDGVDMGLAENQDAAMIVNTNHLREVLNVEKARSVCSHTGNDLLLCAAQDIPSEQIVLSKLEHEQLLRINFSSSKYQGSLPGYLPLYVDMPVILRMRNLSTDLKITNGAQGYIRKISLAVSPQGLTYCSCAIVEFPDSPVKLQGLPQGFFPITPVTFSFTASFIQEADGKPRKMKFSRHQLPIQPGFAVTGHSAQGKTLPKVGVHLHEGGFGAYVAASRAKSRNGLCITQPVRLNDLNKPLPHDLFAEVRRFEVLANNTLILHGFSDGPLLPVPDPESEVQIAKQHINIKVADEGPTSLKKRKSDDQDEFSRTSLTTFSSPVSKRPKKNTSTKVHCDTQLVKSKEKKRKLHTDSSSNGSTQEKNQNNNQLVSNIDNRSLLLSAGCSWTAENWSCAYDSVFMSLYCIYASSSSKFREDFRFISIFTDSLAQSFDVLCQPPHHTTYAFNHKRNNLRDELSSFNPTLFRRFGQVGTSVSAIIDVIFPRTTRKLIILPTCPSCPSHRSLSTSFSSSEFDNAFPTVIIPPEININSDGQTSVFLDDYVSNFIAKASENYQFNDKKNCQNCDSVLSVISATLLGTPPLLFFEIPAETGSSISSILPSSQINLPSLYLNRQVSYRLAAIIYLGQYHFTCRLITDDHAIWLHDGQIDYGRPYADIPDHNPSESSTQSHFLSNILVLNNRKAHIFIYARIDK